MIGITVRAEEMLDKMRAGQDRQREEDGSEDDGPDGPAERDEANNLQERDRDVLTMLAGLPQAHHTWQALQRPSRRNS